MLNVEFNMRRQWREVMRRRTKVERPSESGAPAAASEKGGQLEDKNGHGGLVVTGCIIPTLYRGNKFDAIWYHRTSLQAQHLGGPRRRH